ncbi:MAG: hypothetical protein ACYDC8_14645 [Gammaproteobacteria bacterium]
MSLKISKGFLWRTVASCLLIFDYFLGTTGNPSITYGVLGLFWITLIVVVMIIASYVPASFRGRGAKPFFVLLSLVGVFSVALFVASPYATEFAAARMEAQIHSFIKDPINSKAVVSNEERQLMVKLESQKYSTERETFIPTFRRMDYLFKTEPGEKYRLIMTMIWNGTPVISLRRVDT